MNKVFISYVRENIKIVDRLCQELRSHGIEVWLDRNDIDPGSYWEQAIRRAIQQGAFFIACFSEEYNNRGQTYMNEELTLAIDELRQRSPDQIWFIPVKLNECAIPDRDIGGGKTLQALQYVNLYENWDDSIQRILKVIQPGLSEPVISANAVEQSETQVQPQAANAYFDQGNAYHSEADYDRAIQAFSGAIELKPDYAEAYFNRGNAYHRKGDDDHAIVDHTKAVELKPDFAEAYTNRGLAHQNKGDYDRAISDHNTAIDFNPNYAEAYFNRGGAYKSKDNYDHALVDFTKAIELKPDFAGAYNHRGVVYLDRDDYDFAITDFTKAIDLSPDFVDEVYYNRGLAYHKKSDYDFAIADYTKAIDLSPDFVNEVHYNRGRVWLYLREWEKAKSDFMSAREEGRDIITTFCDDYGSVAGFERRNGVKLPADIAAMLTPQQ